VHTVYSVIFVVMLLLYGVNLNFTKFLRSCQTLSEDISEVLEKNVMYISEIVALAVKILHFRLFPDMPYYGLTFKQITGYILCVICCL